MLGGSHRAIRSIYSRASSFTNSLLTKISNKQIETTMKAYVRTLKEEERIEIKFKYVDSNLGLERWFSFNRSMDDSVQQIKERIVTNIDKACSKYRKRMQKKSPAGNVDAFKLDVELMQNSEVLDSEVACRKLLEMPNVAIAVNGQLFHLDIDPPAVKTLKLPSCFMAGFPVYPNKIELENCQLNECEFIWSKSPNLTSKTAPEASSDTWVAVGSGLSYTTSNLDIGSWLKLECIPKSSSKVGLSEFAIASQIVEAGPGPCPFEIRQNFTKEFVDNSG